MSRLLGLFASTSKTSHIAIVAVTHLMNCQTPPSLTQENLSTLIHGQILGYLDRVSSQQKQLAA